MMSMPLLIAVLLVMSAALFGLGVAIEHSSDGDNHAASAETGQESTDGAENASHAETPTSEWVLGLPAESPAGVAAVVVASLLLAALVWRYPRRPVLIVVAVFGLAAAILDIAEVVRQVDAERSGVGVLALLVAALHTGVVVGAIALIRRRTPGLSRV
jgi:hypothetical protein